MKLILPLLALCYLCACGNKQQPGQSSAGEITTVKPLRDTSITVVLPPDSAVGPVYGYVEKGQSITCYLKVSKPIQLEAKLVALTAGLNLRFNQLFLPDGTSDGPFGNTLTYQFDQTGTYRLVLAPNLTAEGITSGEYLVRFHTQ